MNLRSALYRAARIIGDVKAVSKGPDATVKRVERRALGRVATKLIRAVVPNK